MRAGYVKDQKTYNKKALLRRGNEVYDIDLYQLLNLNKTELNLATSKYILIRQNPPFDMEYINSTLYLEKLISKDLKFIKS